MQLLVVRAMRELVETPQLFTPLVVRPELLDLADEIPHAQAKPRLLAVAPEQAVQFRNRLLAQAEFHRLAETWSPFEHAIPHHAAVLVMLLDALDGFLTVERNPVRRGHVLEQRPVQHVRLLSVAAATELHDRAVGQR